MSHFTRRPLFRRPILARRSLTLIAPHLAERFFSVEFVNMRFSNAAWLLALAPLSATPQAPCPVTELTVDGGVTASTTTINECALAGEYVEVIEGLESTCPPLRGALGAAYDAADIEFHPHHRLDEGCFVLPENVVVKTLKSAAEAAGVVLSTGAGLILSQSIEKLDENTRSYCVSPLTRARADYSSLLDATAEVIKAVEERRASLRNTWPSIDARLARLRAEPKGSNEFEAQRRALDLRVGSLYAFCRTNLIESPPRAEQGFRIVP